MLQAQLLGEIPLPSRDQSGFGDQARQVEILCKAGKMTEALSVLVCMEEQGSVPSVHLCKSLLQVCLQQKKGFAQARAQAQAQAQVRCIHALLAKHGLDSNACVGELLVAALVGAGSFAEGVQLFRSLPQRTSFSWTALVSGYSDRGQYREALSCFQHMQQEGVQPNNYTFVSLLKACSRAKDLEQGRHIHAAVARYGSESDAFVGSSLVSMYARCGSIVDAQQVFDRLSVRTLVTWNAMLAGYNHLGDAEMALQMYWQMQREGVSPDARTFVSALRACGSLAAKEEITVVDGLDVKLVSLHTGKELHAAAAPMGFQADVFVTSILVSVYAKCGSVMDAQQVFNSNAKRDVVSWTAMLTAFCQQGLGREALQIYRQMRGEGLKLDVWAFVSSLQGCGMVADKEKSALVDGRMVKVDSLRQGKEVHAEAVRMGFGTDDFVNSAAICMYSKCGSIKDAERVFHALSKHDLVSWTAMISAYAQQEQGEKALQLYAQLEGMGMTLDEGTFVSILEACSRAGALSTCVEIHGRIQESGFEQSLCVSNSLIHAYSECGSMQDAQNVFDSLPEPDVISWTALIAGYARQGSFELSVECYEKMCWKGVKPNGVTFISLLLACTHAGMVEKGLELFGNMRREHDISVELEHYACVIDLVSRAGLFSITEIMLSQMPMEPDLALWLCLLGACQKHGNVLLGKRAFNGAVGLEPQHSAAYVLMANIYTNAGFWDCAQEVNNLRLSAGAWKSPGQSWIQHEKDVHTFLVGDRRHEHEAMVYALLDHLSIDLKQVGYIGLTDSGC